MRRGSVRQQRSRGNQIEINFLFFLGVRLSRFDFGRVVGLTFLIKAFENRDPGTGQRDYAPDDLKDVF